MAGVNQGGDQVNGTSPEAGHGELQWQAFLTRLAASGDSCDQTDEETPGQQDDPRVTAARAFHPGVSGVETRPGQGDMAPLHGHGPSLTRDHAGTHSSAPHAEALSSTTANSDSEDDYGPPVHVNVVTIERIREVLLGDTEESNPADQEAAEEVQHHSISEDDEVDDNNVHKTASGIGDMVRWLMMKMCYLPPLQEG